MRPNGARKCGTKITETTIRPPTAMTPAPPPARATARRILPSRAISAWLPKAATWTRSSLSKKENPFPAVCGHICDGLTLQTAQPDIFVGGDVATGPKFVIDAIAAGKEAAISLHRYVHEGQSLTIGRNRRVYPELDKRNVALPTACFDAPVRQVPAALSGAEARKTFRDPRCTFTEEQVKKEASRCLGCGVCTTRCEFDAIHLRRDHPEATKMIRSEDKMKAILPYMVKRAARIKGAANAAETVVHNRRIPADA